MRPRIVDYLNQVFGTSLFSWLVPTSAVVYALAMLICLFVFVKRCQKKGLSRYHGLGAASYAMIGGLIGARLFYLLLHFNLFLAKPSIIFNASGGTASWGAYLGGGLSFGLYFLINRQPIKLYADVLASCLGLGPFIGRWSCLLNGCCFGKLSSLPWAIIYPHGSNAFVTHVNQDLIDPLALYSLPVHPLPIYLSLNGLMLFLFFSWLWEKNKLPKGVLFWLYWLAYSFTRFFLEYFRDIYYVGSYGGFSIPQVMAILTFTLSFVVILIVLFTKNTSFLKIKIAVRNW